MSTQLLSRVWDYDVTGNTRAVLQVLCHFADDDGICWPSQKHVAWKVGISDRQVRTILVDLRGQGVVEVIERGGKGPRDTSRVRVHLDALAPKPPYGEGKNDGNAKAEEPEVFTHPSEVAKAEKPEVAKEEEAEEPEVFGPKPEVFGPKPEVWTSYEPSSLEPSYLERIRRTLTSTPHTHVEQSARNVLDDDASDDERDDERRDNERIAFLGKKLIERTITEEELHENNRLMVAFHKRSDRTSLLKRNAGREQRDTPPIVVESSSVMPPKAEAGPLLSKTLPRNGPAQTIVAEWCRLAGIAQPASYGRSVREAQLLVDAGVMPSDISSLYAYTRKWAKDGVSLSAMRSSIDQWRQKPTPPPKQPHEHNY